MRDLLGEVPAFNRHLGKAGGANGYAAPPGSGPAGETCSSCGNCTRHTMQSARAFHKCDLTVHTGGRGSDVLVTAPACRFWKSPE